MTGQQNEGTAGINRVVNLWSVTEVPGRKPGTARFRQPEFRVTP